MRNDALRSKEESARSGRLHARGFAHYKIAFWLPAWLPTVTFALVRCGFRRFSQVPVPQVLRDFRTGVTRRELGFAVLTGDVSVS